MIVSAPGKLMLAGEWAVLELNNPCIVLAVNKRIKVNIKELKENNEIIVFIEAKDIGLKKMKGIFSKEKIEWLDLKEEDKEKILFAGKAIETTLNYLKEKNVKLKSFELKIKSDISVIEFQGKKEKIGFGSSAAVTVAVSGAILALHEFNLKENKTKEIIYKLAAITHYFAQQKIGSAFDIAASTFGGAIIYERFNAEWLIEELKKKKLNEVINEEWLNLRIEKIKMPKDFKLCVAFTGKGASTKDLVLKVNEFKKKNEKEYFKIINSIKQIVGQLINAINENNKKEIIALIKENRLKLKELSDKSNANLETEQLRKLIEIAEKNGIAAKFSGAGGGDNGIAVCFDEKTRKKIYSEWKKAFLTPIKIEIDNEGIKKE